jgi:phosphoribosylcarboxyaminoimidazole (NCAIR) mutase
VTPAALAAVREKYERVAEIVGTFPQMRPGMIAIIVDGPPFAELGTSVARAVGQFGLATVRHIVSVERTPGYVLQLIAQLDATFAKMVVIAVGATNSSLGGMLDNVTANPVLRVDAAAVDLDSVAFSCAKALGLEDTIVYGRVMLMQANVRSSVLQADAQLQAQQQAQQQPPLAPGGGIA